MNPLTKIGINLPVETLKLPTRYQIQDKVPIENKPGTELVTIHPINKVNNELVKLDIEHKHHMEDLSLEIQKEDRAWKSCCFNLHPASTKFIGKFIVSLIIIGICAYQLIVNINNCTAQIGYSSLLSLVVGSWLNIMV